MITFPNSTQESIIMGLLMLATFIHVFRDSMKDPRIGHPWMHALMCVIVIWPLPYLCWLLWWPGKLRQRLFGSDRERIRKKVQRELRYYEDKS